MLEIVYYYLNIFNIHAWGLSRKSTARSIRDYIHRTF